MNDKYTPHQKRYFAEQLTVRRPARELETIAASMSGVKVDLNPHQVGAAHFALHSPISNGSLLADEVGLGKTIEAGLVIAQSWAEGKKKILLVLPASLRIQWKIEIEEKFNIPAVILQTPRKRKGVSAPTNLFAQTIADGKIAIVSIDYAAKCGNFITNIPWDLVVIDEAHHLRNVYKGTKKANAIKDAISGRKKLLLTATPLQNDLKEMFGLASIIDEHLFGDSKAFTAKNISDIRERLKKFCKRTLRQDVKQFGLNFTMRHVLDCPFTPTDDEKRLYDEVSEYLRRTDIRALPEKGRQLVLIVVRKLLASSTFAVSKTLGSFITTLERLIQGYENDLSADLSEDFESYGEYEEEWGDDEGDESLIDADTIRKKEQAEGEIAELTEMRKLAESITTDAKGDKLLFALEEGFKMVKEHKGAEKAVIFTESTRTQKYILDTLIKGGYEGYIVLLNGSNNDDISKGIYAQWKERHKDDGVMSTSKEANMKAAIVEEFRDRAKILIGTEAAAEGINLQFCNMVVNYDLPWNPQRVEQRIGRCHRYGQTHDVVVVNFINESNAADKRVYELLKNKFKLFEGVFGASDAPISVIESGASFEKDILNIYQSCRSDTEINEAFDVLAKKYAESIESSKADTIRLVLETFGEDIIRVLKDCEDRTRASLDEFSRFKFDLFTAYGATRVNSVGWIFEYNGKQYIPSWETAKNNADGEFLKSDSPVYLDLE